VAFGDGGAEGVLIAQGLRGEAEEVQLLGQALGTPGVLQGDVHRLAQRRQKGLFEGVTMTQTGT